MLHRTDERVFRYIELTCYWSLIAGVPVLRGLRGSHWPYFMPLTFVLLASVGLVFMARFFIYAHPENILDRTRAETPVIAKQTKIQLSVGFAMCVPMLILGCIGLITPPLMGRIISVLSPMRLLL